MVTESTTPAVPALLRARFGDAPFLLGDAERLLTRGQVRTALRNGDVVRLRRGVGALAGDWELDPGSQHLHQVRAAQLTLCGAVASHWSAVMAHALPAPTRRDAVPDRPTLTLPRGGGLVDGLQLVAGVLQPADVTRVGPLVVTALPRTGVDVVADRPLTHALVVLDAVARRLLADLAPGRSTTAAAADEQSRLRVLARLAGAAGRRGDREGRERIAVAVALTDPRAESALESWSRAVLLGAELPRPRLQLMVTGESGQAYRADFAWPEHRVIGEADGLLKYADRRDLLAEKAREDDLRRAGWVVVRWAWADITRTPNLVIARLRRELGSA